MLDKERLMKRVRILTLIDLISIGSWLIFMIIGAVDDVPIASIEDIYTNSNGFDWLYYGNYFNAGFFTLATTILFVELSDLFYSIDESFPKNSKILIGIYGGLNLVVYWSQLVFPSQFYELYQNPSTSELGLQLFQIFSHMWNESPVMFLNQLAYFFFALAILPHTWYYFKVKNVKGKIIAGLLLLSNILSILAFTFLLFGWFTVLSVISGGVFFISLVVMLFRLDYQIK